MIRIMLVDDDPLFRSMFSTLIDWSSYGCELSYQAENGQHAIELLNQYRINLVFTDMSMPVVNGVQLIDYISRHMPHIRYVALSGYDDFSYVKESLKHGAIDYLLKHTLTKQDLERVITTYKHLDQSVVASVRNEAELTQTMRYDVLNGLLNGTYAASDDFAVILKASNLPDIRKNILLFSIELEDYVSLLEKFMRLNKHIQWNQTIRSMLQSILDKLGEGVVFFSEDDQRFYALLSSVSFENIHFAEDTATLFATQARNSLKTYFNTSSTIIAAPLCRDIRDVRHAYYHILKELGQYHPKEEALSSKPVSVPVSFTYILKYRIILDDIDAIQDGILSFFDEARERKCSRGQFIELTIDLYKIYLSLSNQFQHTLSVLSDMEITQIFSLKSDSGMQSYILNHFSNLLHNLAEKEKKSCSAIVYSAAEMIRREFADHSLSLSTLASSVHINPSYLSRLFKAEKSVGIMEFINICRVIHAADLLLSTALTVKQISLQCGFENYNYFFKVFKKYSYFTPVEYKENKAAGMLTNLNNVLAQY